jgi:hypothetical protein
MEYLELSPEALMWISYMFAPDEREQVCKLLTEQCGNNLPFLPRIDQTGADRLRFAVLKLSDGDFGKLEKAVTLAKRDWRDLLVAAGFANDLQAHKEWVPERRWRPFGSDE